MNLFQRLILKRLAPQLYAKLTHTQALLDWYTMASRAQLKLIRRQDDAARQQRDQLDQFWQQHELCRDALLSLVALNDAGEWTTVFDANEPVTEELGAYLSALVART